ncbi:MAG: zinc dependent phospholipase C family protein [Lachnospiraceae bacterium]|nr:zinc dependent phospholipase C family protein [Robinsoniella sp.]MDY3765747.1 zinc dependent phospholipase C family protein [Lachnospiraceae bacterium]
MRKKSHISLARFIADNSGILELHQYKKAFCLGSILPDCRLSFLTEKHEFHRTFDKVQNYIRDLTENCVPEERNPGSYWRKIGEVIHYIADYFTFPHNDIYPGNLRDHCAYEKELKFYLREYIKSGEALRRQKTFQVFHSVEALIDYIQEKHVEYLKGFHSLADDCRYIIQLCGDVVAGIVQLLGVEQQIVPMAA